MEKLVVLKLDGDLLEGVRVTLEIGAEGSRAAIEVQGNLPPKPEMIAHYSRWQSTYRSLEDFRITPISISIGGDRTQQLNNCRFLADELSRQLNGWLNSESFRPLKEELLKQLTPDDTVRVLIKTSDIWLRRLPWHLWDFFEDYSLAEVALSASEYDGKQASQNPVTKRDKVKILAILGNSEGIFIDKDRELLETLPNAKITFLLKPQRSKLSEQLWQQGWDILFFAGHSFSQSDGQTGNIYINETDRLTINKLKYALKQAVRGGLQLAIFNSCDGLGLARQLEELHIPQIIVMREPVPDLVAQEFLKHFLVSFSRGESLYISVREAREKLQALEKDFPCATWLPVICQNPSTIPLTWQTLHIEPTINPPPPLLVKNVDELVLLKRIGNSTLQVKYCDITNLRADVIVSADDIYLTMSGGVSEAILMAGGKVIWEEAQRRVPLQLGNVASTVAGQLQAKQIFHAAVVDHRRRYLTNIDLIRKVTRKCLEMCNAQGFRSVAFPALATGAAQLSPEQPSIAMMLEIVTHMGSATNLERVTLAMYGRRGLEHKIISRFYAQVSDFLDMHQQVETMKGVLDDLERIYHACKMPTAAEVIVHHRSELDSMRDNWTSEILKRDLSNFTEE